MSAEGQRPLVVNAKHVTICPKCKKVIQPGEIIAVTNVKEWA